MASENNKTNFDIVAQPMASALAQFAEQAALQSLFYAQEDIQDKIAAPVLGSYELGSALTVLLQNSGLGFRRPEPGIVVIHPVEKQQQATAVHRSQTDSAELASQMQRAEQYTLEELVTIGTRVKGRNTTQTAVPVDVFAEGVIYATGAELGATVQAIAPSFNFSRTTVSDGSDVVRPATLRGLSPDQLLVLINGKRRHHQAQINIQQVVGRGSSGTDINAIPSGAIERIEVLRDGAAAQYGSDAIAGVINIVLKSQTQKTDITTHYGQTRVGDGATHKYSVNTGFGFGGGGYLNLTLATESRDSTNRAGVDTRFEPPKVSMEIGDASTHFNALFFNGGYAVGDYDAYFFGGWSRRDGLSAGFYRAAGAVPGEPAVSSRYIPELYPYGFLPLQTTALDDNHIVLGVRDEEVAFGAFDASITYGKNRFTQGSKRSVNVSLGADSPTSANSGGLEFSQLSVNVDVTRRLNFGWYDPVNFASGIEYRREHFHVRQGDFASYAYGRADDFNIFIPSPIDPCPLETDPVKCGDGSPRDRAQSGMQAYPGYRTAVEKSRDSFAIYVDAESHVSDDLLLGVAGRFEHYGKEGTSTTGKFSFHYQWFADLALRGAFSSGFRVPGLNQRAFTNTFTNVGSGELTQTLHAAEGSLAAQALGVGAMEEERSKHSSLGLIWQPFGDFILTLDLFQIDIVDRIVLADVISVEPDKCQYSGNCALVEVLASLKQNIGAVQLFTNGMDTITRGADLVTQYAADLGVYGQLGISHTIHYNKTQVKAVHAPAGIAPEQFFSPAQIDLTETGQPRQRAVLGFDWSKGPWRSVLRFNRYGKVKTSYFTENSLQIDVPASEDFHHRSSAAWITDIDVSYSFFNGLKLALGGNNVFNAFPDKLAPNSVPAYITGGSFVYPWESTPFGINGAYYYLRMQYSL